MAEFICTMHEYGGWLPGTKYDSFRVLITLVRFCSFSHLANAAQRYVCRLRNFSMREKTF